MYEQANLSCCAALAPNLYANCSERHYCQAATPSPPLQALVDGLLSMLSSAEGDLTENVALIESLEQSKALANEIQEKARLMRRGGGGRDEERGLDRCEHEFWPHTPLQMLLLCAHTPHPALHHS